MKSKYMRFLLLPFAVYTLAVSGLYVFQDVLLYNNTSQYVSAAEMGITNAQELVLKTSDGETIGAWYAAANAGKPTILFCHGKGGSLGGRYERWNFYVSQGYGVLFFDYRGFGQSTGNPSEKGLLLDAATAYEWLIKQGVAATEIVAVGESLGTGICTMLAAEKQTAALALEAPYSSIVDVAAHRHWWAPVRALIHDNFDAVAAIKNVNVPLLLQHGDQDRSVPILFGRKLFDAANQPKEFVTIPGANHLIFNLPTWQREIAFFERVFSDNPQAGQ
jgi:uncharacterized protein